jgi:hypothetical protein
MYDLREASNKLMNSASMLRREGRGKEAAATLKKHKALTANRQKILMLDRVATKLRERARAIRFSSLPAGEKTARIDETRRRMNRVLRDIQRIKSESEIPTEMPFSSMIASE